MPLPPILALDLYGTLLDPSSISETLSRHLPATSPIPAICTSWRTHQLQYTWRLTSSGTYLPFSSITRGALLNALHDHRIPPPASAALDEIIDTYTSALALFPDAEALLQRVGAGHVKAVVFSNGDPEMLEAGVKTLDGRLPGFVSVRETGRYKPAAETYRYLLKQLGRDGEGEEGSVVLVSGNPFDIVGAAAVGLGTVWVDRAGNGWGDQLGKPKWVVGGLGEVVDAVLKG